MRTAATSQTDHRLPLKQITIYTKAMLEHFPLSFCQDWLARPVSLQRKCGNLKKQLNDNPSHLREEYICHPRNVLIEGERCGASPSKWPIWPDSFVKWKASLV